MPEPNLARASTDENADGGERATVRPALPPGPETDIGYAARVVGDGSQVEAKDDLLDIEDDVRTLSRLVLARSTHPPLAVGLFGDWGTGKTFFLRATRTAGDRAGGASLPDDTAQPVRG